MQDGTGESAYQAPLPRSGLSDRERRRLRLRARRYRARGDTSLRPVATVVGDLRMRHGTHCPWARCSTCWARGLVR
jgi:hypothetical protein